jgi:hypothetical protein
MVWVTRKSWWRPCQRRLNTGVALVAYLAAVIGVPTAPTPVKDRSQPFPCQDHICGCRTADACWHHCCCFSPEEKRAWALAHHVEPPPSPQRTAGQGWHTVRLRDQENNAAACCARQVGHTACCQSQAPAKVSPRTGSRPWVLAMTALHCQGVTTLWVHAGTVLPATPPATWNPCLSPGAWLAFPDQIPVSLSLVLLDPPPRCPCA